MNIDKTLEERGKKYGDFKDHAKIAQGLKAVMYECPNWGELSSDKKECLEMVAHKIARILNGDPEYLDNWHDIIGYTRLVEVNIETFNESEYQKKKWDALNEHNKRIEDTIEASKKYPWPGKTIVNEGLPTEVRL